MKTITTHPNDYGDSLKSDDIRVTINGKHAGSTHIGLHPKGCRIENGGPIIEHPVAYCVQHGTVIDASGLRGQQLAAMQTLELNEPFNVEGFDGTWMLAERDQRKLEGGGFKMVPAPGAEPFQKDRKAHAINEV